MTAPRVPRIVGRSLPLQPPLVMGVLNLTPDSFSDGGRWLDSGTALRHAMAMADAGADIIDVGGESTRPGAEPVSLQLELDRVIPLIEGIRSHTDTPVSVDTSKPEVMREAVRAGAGMINDVYALRADGALEAAAGLDVPVCVMHMQGEPRTMQAEPKYRDVVREVANFLEARATACRDAGIDPAHVVIDPGFGFGKTLEHNLALFHALPELCALGHPVLIGISRKSMLGRITGRDVGNRLAGSLAAAVLASQSGASIVRVHDVAETVDALKVLAALTPQ